jgi:fatty-acyl-CoA synthase
MYIGDYLGRRELYTPERLAIIDTGKPGTLRLSYRQLNKRANRLANWFSSEVGINRGDRIAILARDGVEHLDCFFACGKTGAIHTPLNWRLHARELLQLIELTAPKVLIYSDEFTDQVALIEAETRHARAAIPHYLYLGRAAKNPVLHYDDTLRSAPATPAFCEALTEEDTACILFTGGTTGLPKGAMISHRMICWNAFNTVIHDLHHEDIYLCVFPLFHAGGLFAYLSSQVILGNTTVLLPQFDPHRVLELVERERVTVFAAVPTMYQMMTQASNWRTADLGSLRFCTSGGAPLPVPLIEHYSREKGVSFKQGFGMTEFGPGLFALSHEDAIRKAGSIGRPNFFVEARVVDKQNRPLGAGSVGELVLKGPSRCSGYFNDAQASAKFLDDGGWFHSGDLVYFDEEGYFYVTDRMKDMFISGGENVYPAEIEAALYRHPGVQMCAVIGIADSKWGEAGKAFVVLKPDVAATEVELTRFLTEQLAPYKVPKHVVFKQELPLSGMGKILKQRLRQED